MACQSHSDIDIVIAVTAIAATITSLDNDEEGDDDDGDDNDSGGDEEEEEKGDVGIFEWLNPVKGLKLWKPQFWHFQITWEFAGFIH